MDRIVKGIWIPIDIWQDTDLSWNEKILLMEIDSFTSRGRECYISNEYIANLLGVSTRWASQYLSHLVDRNLVKVVRFDGRARYVESNLNLLQAEWKKTSRQGGRKLPHTYNKETGINVEDNGDSITINSESNHTVSKINTILTSQPQTSTPQSLYEYVINCDLNSKQVTAADISLFAKNEYDSAVSKYIWIKTSDQTNVYAGIFQVARCNDQYVFDLIINNSQTGRKETHKVCVIVDTPSNTTFAFTTTLSWNIITKVSGETLYAYLEIPNNFVGSIMLVPLRFGGVMGVNYSPSYPHTFETWVTDKGDVEILNSYAWNKTDSTVSQMSLITSLIGNDIADHVPAPENWTGYYHVDIIGDFGGNLQVGDKISDLVVNDYYLHTLQAENEKLKERITALENIVLQS